MNTTIVKFDALAYSVGTSAQHDNLIAIGWSGLTFILVGGIHIGSRGLKFTRTTVNPTINRPHFKRQSF